MPRGNTEWTLFHVEFLPPGSGGMGDVGGLKRFQFDGDTTLILKGEPEGVSRMDFVLQGNVIVPTAINGTPVEQFLGGTRLQLKLLHETDSELILNLMDAMSSPPRDIVKLVYRRVNLKNEPSGQNDNN